MTESRLSDAIGAVDDSSPSSAFRAAEILGLLPYFWLETYKSGHPGPCNSQNSYSIHFSFLHLGLFSILFPSTCKMAPYSISPLVAIVLLLSLAGQVMTAPHPIPPPTGQSISLMKKRTERSVVEWGAWAKSHKHSLEVKYGHAGIQKRSESGTNLIVNQNADARLVHFHFAIAEPLTESPLSIATTVQ
jgi:hypothetical protein